MVACKLVVVFATDTAADITTSNGRDDDGLAFSSSTIYRYSLNISLNIIVSTTVYAIVTVIISIILSCPVVCMFMQDAAVSSAHLILATSLYPCNIVIPLCLSQIAYLVVTLV
jgi:ethanolamine utilization microcompartment shell protein EutL